MNLKHTDRNRKNFVTLFFPIYSIANVMREAGCPVPEYMLSIQKPSK